jgi:ABC-type nickel/cobalt efflux system permease component RcnA
VSPEAVLAIGLVFGMQHALEADHLAAVATLVARESSLASTLRQGVAWGLGHTLTLLAFGAVVLLLGTVVSERTAHGLEAVVGVMLMLLGLDLLRRMARERVHFHLHRHEYGGMHFHAHSHRGETGPHDPQHHKHQHRRLPLRALAVGMVHGLAGSAALVLMTLDSLATPWWGVAYIALFGLGSMLGMVLLSVVISVPLRVSAPRLGRMRDAMQGAVAVATIVLGASVLLRNVL